MIATKVISTRINKLRRYIKFLGVGKNDVQEKSEISPFGIDSNPIKDMVAIMATTGEIGKDVVIGYINVNQISDVGETRLYSTDEDGNVKISIHLKNDGIAEIGGNDDNLARFSELKSGFDTLRSDVNALISAYNSHSHPYVGLVVGIPGTTSPTPSLSTPSSASIDASKIDELKCS